MRGPTILGKYKGRRYAKLPTRNPKRIPTRQSATLVKEGSRGVGSVEGGSRGTLNPKP